MVMAASATENNFESEEAQAEVEVRLGEIRGKNTIIEVLHPDTSRSSSQGANFTQAQFPPYRQPHPPGEKTYLDYVILGARSWIERIFYPNGCDECIFLEPEEIDSLALFQGKNLEVIAGAWIPASSDDILYDKKIKTYKTLLANEDHIEWERRCRQLLNASTLSSFLLREKETYRAKLRCYLGSWNQAIGHCSPNIFLLDDQFTAHRVPSVNQTDGIRGKLGFEEGIHAWDMKISGPVGTHCSVGISTRSVELSTRAGYISLIGDDENSWGWDIVWGTLSHAGKAFGKFPTNIFYEYKSGDSIRLILDCDAGALSFAVNERLLGVAFVNLPTRTSLYPSISMVYGNIEASLLYLGKPPPFRNYQ